MSWIISKAAGVVGERFARPALIALGVIILVIAILALTRCGGNDYKDDYEAQIEQTDLSTAAVADAAENAIETLEDRVATENAVDQATQAALDEIGDAQSPSTVRAAVVSALCSKPSRQNDPACRVDAESRNE